MSIVNVTASAVLFGLVAEISLCPIFEVTHVVIITSKLFEFAWYTEPLERSQASNFTVALPLSAKPFSTTPLKETFWLSPCLRNVGDAVTFAAAAVAGSVKFHSTESASLSFAVCNSNCTLLTVPEPEEAAKSKVAKLRSSTLKFLTSCPVAVIVRQGCDSETLSQG